MKKIIFVLSFLAITTAYVSAQTHFSLSFDAGKPFGVSAKAYSVILGGTIQAEHPVSTDLSITGRTGFHAYIYDKSYTGTNGSFKIIPLLAGIRYYFEQMYLSGELGAGFSASSGGKTAFMYTPGVGYKVSKNFDITAMFQALSYKAATLNAGVVRFAYRFN